MNRNHKTIMQLRFRKRGSATIIMLALLAILLILVLANGRIVLNLQKELKLIERKQAERTNTNRNHPTNAVDKTSDQNHHLP